MDPSEKPSSPRAGDPDVIRRRRRHAQLQHAEERLRPLQRTKLAEVYWRVHAELHRLGREIAEAGGLEAGGSRLDGE
jgi:hypothetical protein